MDDNICIRMATKQTTTETEDQQTQGEFLSLQTRENIRNALRKYLNTHGVKYDVISYTDSDEADTDSNNLIGAIVLNRDNAKLVVPDPTYNRERLTFNTEPPRAYTVWVSTSDNDRRFLYGWTYEGRDYVIAPYFIARAEDSNVLCSYRMEVTDAVNGPNPENALRIDLSQLSNRSTSNKGFNDDIYRWATDGDLRLFNTLKPGTTTWYWKMKRLTQY